MKKHILLLFLTVLITTVTSAQSSKIIGKIVDKNSNKPIENAIIKVLINNVFTVSNNHGEFSIQAEEGNKIEISHVSYKTKIVVLQNQLIIKLQVSQIDLNEIIVRANPLQDISQSVVINDVEKKISQPRSSGGLFKGINGFGLIKKGAYASEPVFRAFKYEQLNVQYDGGMKVVNAGPNRMDPITTHIIPEEIEKIEIVKGPFTVRFGQNFGGIINLVSKNPTKNQYGFHSSIQGGYEINGNNYVNGISMMFANKDFDVLVNGSHRDFGDYEDGNGIIVPASFKSMDYSAKLGINPAVNQRFKFTWRQSFTKDVKYAGLPMDAPSDDSYLIGIDYKINELSKNIKSLMVKGFYSNVEHLMTNLNKLNFNMVDAKTLVYSNAYGGKIELIVKPSNNVMIYAGADANIIKRNGNRTRIVKMINGLMLPSPMTFIDKVWQNSSVYDMGIFIESKFKLKNNFTLTSGLRTDFITTYILDPAADFETFYGGNIPTTHEVNVSGNIAFKYKKNGFQTQLAFGRGVRTASMVERYINHFTVGVDPYEYVGNPYLKPEINNQIEWSFNKNLNMFKVSGSLFYSFLEDYISAKATTNIPRKFMPTTPPVYAKQFVNIKKASQAGFEFNIDFKVSNRLKFKSSIAYTRAQNNDLNEPLPQIPPFTTMFGAKYEINKFWVALNTRLVAKQNRISTSFMETETPSFGTLDVRTGFEPIYNLTIGFAVLNILNNAYYEHLNFSYNNSNMLAGKIYEPGRNFTTYMKYKF